MSQGGIEEQFEVDRALFLAKSVGEDDTLPVHRRLGEEFVARKLATGEFGEAEVRTDVGHGAVEQRAATVDNDHMVEQAVNVAHLMGGDNDGLVL